MIYVTLMSFLGVLAANKAYEDYNRYPRRFIKKSNLIKNKFKHYRSI